MKRYEKQIDGKTVIKTLKEIVVKKNGKQTFNPSEEMVLADGWVEYVSPVYEPTEAELTERARERKLRELHDYDESREVNNCVIVYQGQRMDFWKDKHERDALKSAVRDYITMERPMYRLDLRELGVSLYISCETLLGMLAQLEVYATDCYNRTTDHEYAIKALTGRAEIESYEFRHNGYPEIPKFEIP